MSSPELSISNTDKIVELADASAKVSTGKARTRMLWALGLGAVAAVAAVFAPAVPLVALVAGASAIVAGGLAADHVFSAREMENVQQDAKKDGFAGKLKARAEKLQKLNKRSGVIAEVGLWSYVLTTAGSLLFPPAAPVFLGLRALASVAWFGGAMTRTVTSDTSNELLKLDRMATELALRDSTAAAFTASNENAPALAKTPSPATSFNRHGGSAPPAAAFADDKPPSPKIAGLGM